MGPRPDESKQDFLLRCTKENGGDDEAFADCNRIWDLATGGGELGLSRPWMLCTAKEKERLRVRAMLCR